MCGIWAAILAGQLDPSQLSDLEEHFQLFKHRGPDFHTFRQIDSQILYGFHRLSIIDPTSQSNQPLVNKNCYLICNGEIYNYPTLIKEYNMMTATGSDCETILHLYSQFGIEKTITMLDAEFAFVLYDSENGLVHAARDPFGVRPLFWGERDGSIYFSSELSGVKFCHNATPFLPGCFVTVDLKLKGSFVEQFKYNKYFHLSPYNSIVSSYSDSKLTINYLLTEAVKKRLMSDRPLGCLLSGGVDSSLITSIVAKLMPDSSNRLSCFTIGMADSVDVIAAKKVASYLNLKNHHIIEFTPEDGFAALPFVILLLGTYDVTTVRASIPQYLMAKYISEMTDIKVLLSGEGSDELFASYQYFKHAPSDVDLYLESNRLLEELYLFDNKRTDRTMSGCSLEVRVPFLDIALTRFVTGMTSSYRMCNNKMEKTVLREAFSGDYLPSEILFRSKEAFSDAVSSKTTSWYKSLGKIIDSRLSDSQFEAEKNKYTHNPPQTKEAFYYRSIFEKFYPNKGYVLPHYWMPKWVDLKGNWDPSATVLDCHRGDLEKK